MSKNVAIYSFSGTSCTVVKETDQDEGGWPYIFKIKNTIGALYIIWIPEKLHNITFYGDLAEELANKWSNFLSTEANINDHGFDDHWTTTIQQAISDAGESEPSWLDIVNNIANPEDIAYIVTGFRRFVSKAS